MEHLAVTLFVPLALFLVGGLGKRLVRKGWSIDDAFLGTEAAIAALTGSLGYLFDVVKVLRERIRAAQAPPIDEALSNLVATGLFTIAAFMLYLLLLSIQQDFQGAQAVPFSYATFWKNRGFMLGCLSNAIGFGLLVCFLLIIKVVA